MYVADDKPKGEVIIESTLQQFYQDVSEDLAREEHCLKRLQEKHREQLLESQTRIGKLQARQAELLLQLQKESDGHI